MPPKRTIIVDPDAILLNVHRHIEATRAEIDRLLGKLGTKFHEGAGGFTYHADWWGRVVDLKQAHQAASVVAYDLAVFSGRRDLSASEKQRWRQAVLELERQKLLTVYGQRATHVELTKAGHDRVAELTAKRGLMNSRAHE